MPRRALLDVYQHLSRPGTRNIGNLVFAHSTYKALPTPHGPGSLTISLLPRLVLVPVVAVVPSTTH